MSNKFVLLLLLSLLLLSAISQAQKMRLRLPPGYNMRLGSMPPGRFVGKGAYTLAGKRNSPAPNKWPQQKLQQHKQQQQQLQQQQLQQQQQRKQLFQWATMAGKKYN